MKFKLPQNIEYVLETLISNGHKAYIVGGCVRDLLCGKTPHDYDITTSALPQTVQSLFEKTVATGLKHGTVTVIIGNEQIEVTTFRTEGSYNDSRHPEQVNFVLNVKDDLARRDFTINAMCYNHLDGLIDYFNGKSDIKTKTLKAVGDAEIRFTEDALRILRLFRFAATLDFSIEEKTFNAAIKCSSLLKNISAERVFSELKKTAVADNVDVISSLLQTKSLSNYFLENANLDKLSKLECKEHLRTFALLNLTSTNLPNTLDAFKCSNNFKEYCIKMNYFSKNIIKNTKVAIKKALDFSSPDIVYDAFFYYNDILDIDVSFHQKLLDEIIVGGEPYKISHLDISGTDIMKLGFKGEQIKEKLNYLLDLVICDPSLNERSKLLNLICN